MLKSRTKNGAVRRYRSNGFSGWKSAWIAGSNPAMTVERYDGNYDG
jgi:hypothetical protein